VVDLINNTNKTKQMAQSAYESLVKNYTWNANIAKMETRLNDVISGRQTEK